MYLAQLRVQKQYAIEIDVPDAFVFRRMPIQCKGGHGRISHCDSFLSFFRRTACFEMKAKMKDEERVELGKNKSGFKLGSVYSKL